MLSYTIEIKTVKKYIVYTKSRNIKVNCKLIKMDDKPVTEIGRGR